jgi:ankyrin repeat protein
MQASLKDRRHAAQALIRDGANVNAVATDGSTALMRAAARNNIVIVDMLIRAGAKVTLRADHGITALAFATHLKFKEIAAHLRLAGAIE